MRQIVVDMVHFLATHEVGPSLETVRESMTEEELHACCGKLLSWIRERGHGCPDGRYDLAIEKPFPRLVRDVIARSSELSAVFAVVDGRRLKYAPALGAAERARIEGYVDEKYDQGFGFCLSDRPVV
jgi:hypothetical protein